MLQTLRQRQDNGFVWAISAAEARFQHRNAGGDINEFASEVRYLVPTSEQAAMGRAEGVR